MTSGIGMVTWWGFSPALDLQEELGTINKLRSLSLGNCGKGENPDELNILLIGAGDIRHILKTIAHAHRHQKQKKINFFVLENCLELYCRHLLFLRLISSPMNEIGFQDKMEFLLEIYGNTLIRDSTWRYIQKASNEGTRIITDLDYAATILPFVELDLLLYKERDCIESIFKFWKNPDMKTFNVDAHWDHRSRQYLGTRFDYKDGAADWDYSMKLVDRNAGLINIIQYKKWRRTGVAFELRDANYIIPNRTIASGIVIRNQGEKLLRRGYWGDIVTSPYIAFGIECEDPEYLKKYNNSYRKTAQEVSARNVIGLLYEMTKGKKYVAVKVNPPNKINSEGDMSTPGTSKQTELPAVHETTTTTNQDEAEALDETKIKNADEIEAVDITEIENHGEVEDDIIDVAEKLRHQCRVVFLPGKFSTENHYKHRFHKLFDVVYCSNGLNHLLKPEMEVLLAENAVLLMESTKFLLDVRSEKSEEFAKKLVEIASKINCKLSANYDTKNDAFIKFHYEPKISVE